MLGTKLVSCVLIFNAKSTYERHTNIHTLSIMQKKIQDIHSRMLAVEISLLPITYVTRMDYAKDLSLTLIHVGVIAEETDQV